MDSMDFLLVVSNMAVIFHNIWDVIRPIDELIVLKMVKTTNQIWILWIVCGYYGDNMVLAYL